jgi:hypothetical protein
MLDPGALLLDMPLCQSAWGAEQQWPQVAYKLCLWLAVQACADTLRSHAIGFLRHD